jgi:hypothetical protein
VDPVKDDSTVEKVSVKCERDRNDDTGANVENVTDSVPEDDIVEGTAERNACKDVEESGNEIVPDSSFCSPDDIENRAVVVNEGCSDSEVLSNVTEPSYDLDSDVREDWTGDANGGVADECANGADFPKVDILTRASDDPANDTPES